MTGNSEAVHACPECGGSVCRVHRHVFDRLVALALNVRRYRCEEPKCGWEGIISIPDAAATSAQFDWPQRLTWMAVGAGITLAGAAGIQQVRKNVAPPAPIAVAESTWVRQIAAGESHDGVTLLESDQRVASNRSDLTLRHGCAWGVPGRRPFKGSIRQALIGARLPEEVVNKVEVMAQHGIVSDRVNIRRDSIQNVSGKRRFDTTIVAMAFADTLCFDTRVNFQPDHVEQADLYDATDASGKNFAVMVPYACNNVSVLGERAERPENGHRVVSAPGTLASVLAGLAALCGLRLRQQRNRPSTTNKKYFKIK